MTKTSSANGEAAPDGRDPPPQPVYARVEDWVTEYFLPVYRRPLGGEFRWCADWWEHAEAITRLTALWHAWEALRLQPGTGIATWLRDHLDHHLPVLLGHGGPFAHCSEDEHIDLREATVHQAPPGWWDTGPTAATGSAADTDPATDTGGGQDALPSTGPWHDIAAEPGD